MKKADLSINHIIILLIMLAVVIWAIVWSISLGDSTTGILEGIFS